MKPTGRRLQKSPSLAKEITRAERAIERYHDAFENGDLDPARFKQRLSALDTRLDALHGQDQALALELAADTPTTPDTATLHAIADRLDHVIANGEPEQAKALLAILVADLRINSRTEVLHPPIASAHLWFARRQVQWAILGSNQ